MSKLRVNEIEDLSGNPLVGSDGVAPAAWGRVTSGGTLESGLNCNVTRASTGSYTVNFQVPMPTAVYSVVATAFGSTRICSSNTHTANSFTIAIRDADGVTSNGAFSFAVFATNALPPARGTGADAWCESTAGGGIQASYNIASYTRTATGAYDVVFATPMPSDKYAVLIGNSTGTERAVRYESQTTTGFNLRASRTDTGADVDTAISFAVHATNATLPNTFTQEQIQGVIDANPQGIANAWVTFDGTDSPTILQSFNVSSITDTGTGKYWVNFTNPMSSTNYCVVTGIAKQGSTDNGQATVTVGSITDGSRNVETGRFPLTTAGASSESDSAYITAAVFGN